MIAEIITVGTEILLGDIFNTNTHYLSKRLSEMGIFVYKHTTVGDNEKRLEDAFSEAFKHCDIVITTGGLGPTEDDLTKETAAKFFGMDSAIHETSLKKITEFFHKIGRTMTDNNIKQALFPIEAIILDNEKGTAPGGILQKNGKYIIFLPGPPREMTHMFENHVVPFLRNFQTSTLVSRSLHIIGIGESSMETMIKDLIPREGNLTVAPYAKDGECLLRITASAENEKSAHEMIDPMEKAIREKLGDNIYGTDEETLAGVTSKMLIDKGLTLSIAESCTGGMLASEFVDYPGISKTFLSGIVSYSNDSKIRDLSVKKETLEKYGAVSAETAEEMVSGIVSRTASEVGISVTGIAGPDGGTNEKPVGLVYTSIFIKGTIKTKKLFFSGDRQIIRKRTVLNVIDFLRRELLNLD